MATGLKIQLTGQIGEHLVTAELGRRGIIATPFAGNVPEIDILAFANGISSPIQVKAINGVSWQFDIRRFLDVELKKTCQKILGKNKQLDRKLMCIFVDLGEKLGQDEFYIFRYGWLQDHFHRTYTARRKPKNIKSYHCAIWKKDMERHKENWKLLEKEFKLKHG
jgi:hypothetical protein